MRFIVNVTIFSTHFFTLLLVKIKDDDEIIISSVGAKEVVYIYVVHFIVNVILFSTHFFNLYHILYTLFESHVCMHIIYIVFLLEKVDAGASTSKKQKNNKNKGNGSATGIGKKIKKVR